MKRKLKSTLVLLSLSMSLVTTTIPVEANYTRDELLQTISYGGVENIPIDAENFLYQVESQMDAFYQTYGENLYSQNNIVQNMIRELYSNTGNTLSTGLEGTLVDYAFNYYSQLLINSAPTTTGAQARYETAQPQNSGVLINRDNAETTVENLKNALKLSLLNQEEETLKSGITIFTHTLEQNVMVYEGSQGTTLGVNFRKLSLTLVEDLFGLLAIDMHIPVENTLYGTSSEAFQMNEGMITHLTYDQAEDEFHLLVTFDTEVYEALTGRNADQEIEVARIEEGTHEIFAKAATVDPFVGTYSSTTSSPKMTEYVFNRSSFESLSEKDQHITVLKNYLISNDQKADDFQEMIVSGEGIVQRKTGEGFGIEEYYMSDMDESSAKLNDTNHSLYLIYNDDQSRIYVVSLSDSGNSTTDDVAMFIHVTEYVGVD